MANKQCFIPNSDFIPLETIEGVLRESGGWVKGTTASVDHVEVEIPKEHIAEVCHKLGRLGLRLEEYES